MKRIFYSATALCALFALSSCSNDDAPINDMGNDGVSFRIVVPSSLATRATFGDESTVSLNNLQWSVFDMSDENAPSLVFSNADKSAFQSSQSYETVNLQLVKGNRYQVVFYADNQENTFVTCENGVINVDYSQAVPNVANEDAFVGKSGIFTVSDKGYSETVTLRRPFAQLNWGSDDLKAESVKPLLDNLTATVRISSPIYTTMDILSGNLGGETEGDMVTPAIAMNNLPEETFPVVHDFKTYDLIAMNYLLTGETIINCKLVFGNGTEVNVKNAPVNMNHRTNIYGSLLTAPGSFNIVVDNKFDTPDHNIVVTTAEDFIGNVADGMNVIVEEGTVINITDKGAVELADGQTITVNGVLQTTRQQIGLRGEGKSATIEGSGTIVAVGANGSRSLNVYDGATLTVKGVTVNATQNNGGPAIYSDGGNLVLKGMKVLDSHNFAVGTNGGTLEATDCEFYSDSNNKQGAWSYTVSVSNGCQAELRNVTVTGIQGGLTVEGAGSHCTIYSGTYSTHTLNGMAGTAFYPVYVCDNGSVDILGGEFISGHANYSVFDGDNDVNKPFADYINIKGGKFNKPTYSQKTKTAIEAAEGYEWKTINQSPFILEVVKKQ